MENKKIAFLTEMDFSGKIPRNHPNMRTEFAWLVSTNADHIPLLAVNDYFRGHDYDLGIIIVPKKNTERYFKSDFWPSIRPNFKKIAIMQEGPHWYFQDYTVLEQFNYYQLLLKADFLLCHNSTDVPYYKGLTGKNVYPLQSLMITDNIKPEQKLAKVMIGGTLCSWYSGFDSYRVADEFGCPIYAPSMGRKKQQEDYISDLNYLPYMNWTEWIHKLSEFRYAVHLMRTYAAGTFALNCAYLGIPCIGYNSIDTQNILHTELSVNEGDIEAAKYLASELRDDTEFYEEQTKKCKENYDLFYSEEIFLHKFNDILKWEGI